ncbi:hypothetical protein L7F22_061855 [Adiantum nelumboides]|nr:hypothetical protein [Adiantum nelumboides]
MAALHILLLLPLLIFDAEEVAGTVQASRHSSSVQTMGINYGRIADNLPSATEAVRKIQSMGLGRVKIFDSNSEVLTALANTGLQVCIAVTNEELLLVASDEAVSDQWINTHVNAYYPATLINIITVGNEVLSDPLNQTIWFQLLPAMQNIYSSLTKFNLHKKIKVTTSSALNTLSSSYPPSSGCFRDDIAAPIMQPMLQFLTQTRSYFFLNVYPYLTWAANPQDIPLAYALLDGNGGTSVQDGQLQYHDLLDAQLDAIASAISKLGYPRLRIAISETGWPTFGDEDEEGANAENARTYNQRLVKKMLTYPPVGTPMRPRVFVPTYIFSLYNENLKPGPTTERNWGILYPSGDEVYTVDLTDRRAGAGVWAYTSSNGKNATSSEVKRASIQHL